jgi:hypothetical protein
VRDENGEGLPGLMCWKKAQNGTATDAEGVYKMWEGSGSTGFTYRISQPETGWRQSVIDVSLEPDIEVLEELYCWVWYTEKTTLSFRFR